MVGAGSALPVAVGAPVLAGLLSPSTSTVTLAGKFRTGGVVSTTVMIWSPVVELPVASVAVQVLVMT